MDLLSKEEKFKLLNLLIRNGIEELCNFAKQHQYLEAPYGKKPDPTPLISEEDFVKSGGLHCDDKDPEFSYDYGFDPVKFLGQYLVWAHPDSVESRRQMKEGAFQRLQDRVAHARKQLETHQLLQTRAQNFRSGITWGPIAIVVDPTSVRLAVRTFKAATVLMEIAASADFIEDARTFRMESVETEANTFVGYVDAEKLRGDQVYFVRAIAVMVEDVKSGGVVLPAEDVEYWHPTSSDPANSGAPLAAEALHSTFFTAPIESEATPFTPSELENDSSSETKHDRRASSRPTSRSTSRDIDAAVEAAMRQKVMSLRCLGQLPVEAAMLAAPALPSSVLREPPAATTTSDSASVRSVDSRERTKESPSHVASRPADFTAILSDAFWHKNADFFSSQDLGLLSATDYAAQLSAVLQRVFYTLAAGHPTKHRNNTALLWAYRDAHPRAMAALRLEELAFKQYSHDLKKYNKKYDLDSSGQPSKSSSRSKPAKPVPGSAAAPATVNKDIPPPPSLKMPELSPQLQALLHQLPIPLSMIPTPPTPAKEDKPKKPVLRKPGQPAPVPEPVVVPVPQPIAPRMLYRAVPLCSDVLAVVLDLRRTPDAVSSQGNFAPACDYLGREQADWLSRILRKSPSMWKLILCPKTFGAALVREQQMEVQEGNNSRPATGSMAMASANRSGSSTRPSTVPVDPASSADAGMAVTEASAASVAAAPGAGGLKRQVSSNSQARFVHVLEPEKDESKNLEPVYDEVDDTFGRSKCSLQYVLARYQEKLTEERAKAAGGSSPPPVLLPPPLFPDMEESDDARHGGEKVPVPQYYVSSGIVLVTGGAATAFTRTILTRIQQPPSPTNNSINLNLELQRSSSSQSVSSSPNPKTLNQSPSCPQTLVSVQVSDLHDVAAPSFCASYAELSSTSANAQNTSILVRTASQAQLLHNRRSASRGGDGGGGYRDSSRPNSSSSSSSSSGGNAVTLPPHALPFCFEVSLGQGAATTAEGATFCYLPGFDARTLYLQEPSEAPTSQGDSLAAAQCEVSLLADGRLEIACHSPLHLETADKTLDRAAPATTTCFRCRLTVPMMDEDDASTQSADSIHVA